MITLEDIERIEQSSQWDGQILELCAAARRGVEADDRLAYLEEAYQSAMRVGSEAQRRAEEAVAERDAAVVANCPRMCDDFCNEYQTVLRAEKTEAANVKLVGAIDMIRETLNGSNVQDLLLIINSALDEAKNV